MTHDQAVETLNGMGYSEDDTRDLLGRAVAGNGRPVHLGGGAWVRYEVPKGWDQGGYSVKRR